MCPKKGENKYKRKEDKPSRETDRQVIYEFEKMGEELCPIFQLSEEKQTFAIVEGGKVDFFLN